MIAKMPNKNHRKTDISRITSNYSTIEQIVFSTYFLI